MAITDELREWARNNTVQDKVLTTYPVQHHVHGTVESLLRIADRIDTEHERGMEERADRYSELRAKMNNCYVELPKDADGEYIHLGDMMENNERVVRIVLTDDSWEPSVYLEKLPNVLHEYFCHEISHYHAPTVEDVLREFVNRWMKATCYQEPNLIAEYAAKLREMLAGDAE